MKKIIGVIGAIAILLLAGTASSAGEIRSVDWIVAVVDADIVTFTEFVEELRIASARTGHSLETLAADEKEQLTEQVIEKMVTDSLLLQEAKRRSITVSPAEADDAANSAVEKMKAQFVDENAFERALASEFTTPERIRARYRDQSEAQLYRSKLIDREVRKQIKITDSDVVFAYSRRSDEIRVRHILVADLQTAEEVRAKMLRGDGFETVAKSVRPIEAADLGWVRRGTLVQAFEDAAYALHKDEISHVVKTRFGYHVIQLMDRRTIVLPPMTDEIRERVFNELYAASFDSHFGDFLDRLKSRAYVELRENALKPIY